MKMLILAISAVISSGAWADLSQLQGVLADPQVQGKIPADGLLSVTVTPLEVQKCAASYTVNALYPSYKCSLDVVVGTCQPGATLVGALNCEVSQRIMEMSATVTATPSFAKDIKPIFQAKCTMCHGSGKSRPENFTDYATAVANKSAINARVVENKDMPMGVSMDQGSRDLIGAWVNAGTPK